MGGPMTNRQATGAGGATVRLAVAALGGPERARERHVVGPVAAARPVDGPLDLAVHRSRWSPLLAADGCNDDECPGAGMIVGIGRRPGANKCMIVANDATVKGARTTRSP